MRDPHLNPGCAFLPALGVLLETIPSVSANQWHLAANLKLLTRGSLLLIPLQLGKNYPEISSIHCEKEKKIIMKEEKGEKKQNKEKKNASKGHQI